jgi:hypothetical protein
MTGYDLGAWSNFANTVPSRAAALTGLLFVGLSLNKSEVLTYPGVPARAPATLGLTVAILLIANIVPTPGQDPRVLAGEIAVVGLATAAMVIFAAQRQRSGQYRARALTSALASHPGAAGDRRGGVAMAAAGAAACTG